MAKITTVEHVQMIKNYVDDKTDDGYHINGGNLTFRDSNEIIISGVNATVNSSGTVDGVTISGGKVILSPDVFGAQDIKLEKASGIYRGYEIELEAGTELTAPVYTPSVLSADNGTVTYQSHSQTEGYIFENGAVKYGEEIPQAACTISGLQTSLTVDNGEIAGLNFDYNAITIPASAVGTTTIPADDETSSDVVVKNTVTISSYNAILDIDAAEADVSATNSTFKGGEDFTNINVAGSGGNTFIFDTDNVIQIRGFKSSDKYIVDGVRYYPHL